MNTTIEPRPFHIHLELNLRELEAFYYVLYSARSSVENRIAKGWSSENDTETLAIINKLLEIKAT